MSVLLLLVTVAVLPGVSFSVNSSITSFDNTVTFINEPLSVPTGFETKEKILSDGNTAVELVTEGKDSFCGDGISNSATITINASEIAIYIWFERTGLYGRFSLDITADTSYNSIYVLSINDTSGYLNISNGNGSLSESQYTAIKSTSGSVSVTVDGLSIGVPIHFSIVVVN